MQNFWHDATRNKQLTVSVVSMAPGSNETTLLARHDVQCSMQTLSCKLDSRHDGHNAAHVVSVVSMAPGSSNLAKHTIRKQYARISQEGRTTQTAAHVVSVVSMAPGSSATACFLWPSRNSWLSAVLGVCMSALLPKAMK
jgi:hypothetical protein